jgi:hypothetical protein
VWDPPAVRASPNRRSDLAFGKRARQDGIIDLLAAAGISGTNYGSSPRNIRTHPRPLVTHPT